MTEPIEALARLIGELLAPGADAPVSREALQGVLDAIDAVNVDAQSAARLREKIDVARRNGQVQINVVPLVFLNFLLPQSDKEAGHD